MKLIKNKKGAAFVTVLAVLMAVTILVISFATISFWSYKASERRVQNDKDEALILSVIDSIVSEIKLSTSTPLTKELERINPEGTYKNEAVGTLSLSGISGAVTLKFIDESKAAVLMTIEINSMKKTVQFRRSYKSSITIEMEKIYTNAFFFEGSQYWSQQMSVTGNLYLNSPTGMSVGTRENPHKGNVISCGNLDLNDGSTILGDVVVNGDLTLNSNVLISGKVEVNGDIVITSASSIAGKVTALGGVTNYGGMLKGEVYCHEYNFARNNGQQIEGNLYYLSSLRINYSSASAKEVQSFFVSGEAKRITSLAKTSFPEPLKTEDWKAPQLTESILPFGNTISSSGILDLGKVAISKNQDLILDTEKDDLHIVVKGDLTFSKDIIIKGKNRAFIYVSGNMKLSGYVGKMTDIVSSEYPSQCRLFFISSGGYPIFKLEDNGRLDGYVYFKRGEFYADGKGIFSGGREYKIVGSVCASNTYISKSVRGEIMFAAPNLEGIIFNENQNIIENKVLVWELEKYL